MVPEVPFLETPSPEGYDRLKHPKLLWISLDSEEPLPDIILFFSLGKFTLTPLDPRNGELIYDTEAARCIYDHRIICLYPPNAEEGDQIMIQMETRLPDNLLQRSGAVYVFHDGDWQEGQVGKSELVDLRPFKTSPSAFPFSFFFGGLGRG